MHLEILSCMPVRRVASLIRDFIVKERLRRRKEQIIDPEQKRLMFAEARVLGGAVTNKKKVTQALRTMRTVLRSDIALMEKAREVGNKGLEEAARKQALVVLSGINRLYKVSLQAAKKGTRKKELLAKQQTVVGIMQEFERHGIPVKTATFSQEDIILSRIIKTLEKNKPKKKH